jgi:hypothetical protein
MLTPLDVDFDTIPFVDEEDDIHIESDFGLCGGLPQQETCCWTEQSAAGLEHLSRYESYSASESRYIDDGKAATKM